MLRRFATKLLFAVRWVAAALLAVLFTALLPAWLIGTSCRDVIDSREFWVAWVREAHLSAQLRGGAKGALAGVEGHPALASLRASPAGKVVIGEAVAAAELQLGDELDTQLGEHLDEVIAFLTARTNRLPFDLGLKAALGGAARKASAHVMANLCPEAGLGGAQACDALGRKAASTAATGVASWIASSSVAERLTQGVLGAVTGLHQVRAGALAVRAAIHLVGLAALGCLTALVVIAWRLRTIATLLGSSLLVTSALLTSFVALFSWGSTKLLGPVAGEVASSAAGLQPFGVGLHLALAGAGLGLIVMRLVLPRWRARFWGLWRRHGNPEVRRDAERLASSPACLLEPAHVVRVLRVARRRIST